MFSPTVSSSSSIPFRFFSASSALSRPLKSLLGGLLKLLHVLTNSFQFFLDTLQVLLSQLCSFKTSQEPSRRTSQAASCSHQQFPVLPRYPSGSSQPALLFQDLSRAFSADFSSCFMFSPTVSSSSSIPFRFFSASSALSRPLLSSDSWTPNFLLNSSSFCSLSTAILMVDLRFLS